MPTITMKSEDGNVECFYDSSVEKDKFFLTVQSGLYGFITIRVNKYDLDNLISTLKNFDEAMRATGQIKI